MRQRIGRRLISIMLSVLMLVSLLPTAVFAEELQNQATAGVTEQVGEETGNTVEDSNENKDSTGGEETKGESSTPYVAKVGGKEYATLEEAIAAAEPVNGVITYEIYGKAEVTSTDSWIQVLKTGLSNVIKVVFVGMTTDAEIIITNSTSVLADQKYDIDVSFENLTLSHPNGEWVNDLGHTTNYFACLLRNIGAAENTVTYTNCTFPNGVCDNQYGKTVFDSCKFTNDAAGKYNLWNYGGNTEIRNSTFTGTRGIKAYNEGTLPVAPTVKVENTTFDGLTEKAAIVASKPVDIAVANVGVTGEKGFITRDITGNGEVQLNVSGFQISGNFNITSAATAEAAKDEFNITGGTFNGAVSKDYLAEGTELKQNENGTYGVKAAEVASVGGVVYPTLEAAFAALSTENHTLTLIKADAWAESTPVYWKAGDSKYTAAATLAAALTAAYMANGDNITIVCRPGADVGTMTHGHVADNVTIYGNNAYLSGGECDLEVDTFKFSRTTGKQDTTNGVSLDKNIAINAYELDNLGVWGERHTTYEVNVNLTGCDGKAIAGKENVQRVYISGTTGVNNITLTGCNFLTAKTAVYSNANGAIVVDGCSFTGTAIPVNINHKAAGAVTVEVKNSTFTGCGSVKSGEKQYAAPIRFVNSGSGTMRATVGSCTITSTQGTNGDILIGDGRTGQASNDLSLKVTETTGQVQVQKPGYWITNNRKDPANETHFDVASTATFETSIKKAFITATTGTETDPYTLEQFNEMTRAEYIAAQDRLGGTMYVTVGEYAYATQGVLGNGTADNSDRDSTKLNYYGAPGAKEGQYSDAAVGKSVVFVGDSIENEAEGYTDIDRIGTSLLLAVPAYTNVTFKGIDFYGVFSFNYQLYTSPWSQLGSLNFEGCTFNGLIVGAIAAQTLKFEGCTFNEYSNSASTNNSNPIWVRPAYGNWTKDDNEGQGENFKSLTTIAFTGNTVNSIRPVKFERIAQWEMDTKVTATDNTFNIRNDGSGAKNVGMYFGANAKFDLVVDNNKASSKTAGLYTAVYSAPNGTNYPGLPAGSTVKDSNGETSVDALVWKSTDKLTLKTTEEVAQLTTTKGVVKFATLQEAIAEAKDGDIVTLLKDVTEDVTISKSITLDLGGKTLTNTDAGKATISVNNGVTATVKNGSVIGGASYYNIEVTKGSNADLTLENVTATAGNTGSSMIDNWGTLTIKSGTYTGGLNTVKSEEGSKLTINGGKFTLNYAVKGYTGVILSAGMTRITGGEFIQELTTAGSWDHPQVVLAMKVDGYDSKIEITGGTFTNKKSGESIFRGVGKATSDNFEVSGGTFNKSIPEGYWADGYGVYQTGTGKYEAMTTRVAKIDNTYYETLEGAVNAATAGQTVTLVTDVTIANQLVINKKLTLNLNKKTLTSIYSIPQSPTSGADRYALVNNAELTIKSGTFKAGQARAIGAYAALTLSSATVTQELRGGHACVAFCAEDTAYTIRSSKIDGAYAVCSFANNATINISRSTLIGTGNTLYHNGSNYGLKLTVKDTTITSSSTDSCGVYISGSTTAQDNTANQNGARGYQKATFTNCTISGANGVEVKYTDLTLDNCTVEAAVKTPSYTQNNNGPAGVGFAVVSTDNAKNGETPKPEGKITVTGEKGHYTGPVGLGSLESVKTGYPNFADKTIDISAGTFSCAVPEDYCADGFIPTKNADGTYGVKAGKYVAEVKGTKYETLQEAVDAARNTTVKMLADTKENVTIAKAMTLDLNGHTLNGGTEKGKPALTVTARVTVKDSSTAQTGTIMREDTAENSGVSSHYVIDVQGVGWLTFESGIVKNNSGNAEGKGASLVRVGDDSVKKQPGLVINGGTFTQDNFIAIKVDRGYLKLNGGKVNSANSYAVENWFNATIKGGTVNGAVSSWTYSAGTNSFLTIEGGTVNGDVTSVNYGNAEGKKATVTIKGGTFTGKLDTRSYDLDTGELTSIVDAAKATIKVSGGTFDNAVEARYCDEGYTPVQNSDGKYGVQQQVLAKIGDTAYYTMDEAFHAVLEGETIVMKRDYTTGAEQNSGSKSFAIDLGGHIWTYTGTNTNCAAFQINYPNVTLTVKNGTVVSNSMVGLIPSAMGGTITYDNAGLVFEDVKMTAKGHSGIETNGNNTNDSVKLVNSELNVPDGFGIYFPSSGTLTIENSTINAKTMGVQVCAGSLSINAGSAITVTGDAVPKTENDGAIQDGAAVSIVNRTGYKGLGTVKIDEGTFVAKAGNQAIKAYNWANKSESDFTQGEKVTIAEEKVLSSSADTGVTPTAGTAWVLVPGEKMLYAIRKISDCEAEINGTYYLKLQDAIDAANSGDTVVLVKDVNTPEVTYVIDKALTIDLNGKTVTGSGYDGVFQIDNADAKVLIKNGNIVAVENTGSAGKYAMAIWACKAECEVTLENLNVSQKITHTDDKQMDMIYTSGGTIIINSGNFASGTPAWTLNCKDAAYKDGTANIIVNGGTFKGFDPMNNQAEGKGTSFVAAGVGVDHVDGKFTAKSGMTAQVVGADGKSVKAFEKLSDALTAVEAKQTVKLLNSVTGEKYVEVEANVTLDLNGHSITDARLLYVTGQIIDTAVTKGTVKADGYYINRDNEYTPVYDSEKDGYSLFKLSVKTWWYATEKKVQFALDRDMADFSAAVALMNANSNGRRVKAQVEFSWVDSAQNVKGKQAFELGETYMSQYLANASNLAPYVTIKGLETIEGTVSVQVSFVISKDELGNELFTLYGNKGTIKQ